LSATPLPALPVVSDGLPLQPRPKGLPDLKSRALMYHNRDQKAAAVYLGRISDLAPLRDPKAKAALMEYRKTKAICSRDSA
jgi:hypothetical protein